MRILIPVPLKPIVLVWGLLSGMILAGFIASSVVQGKVPFTGKRAITHENDGKAGSAHTGQRPKHSKEAAQTANR